jgi:hypothetical protein
MKFGTRRSKGSLHLSENDFKASACCYLIINSRRSPVHHNCPSLCVTVQRERRQSKLHINHIFSLITGNKTKMLLLIFLCLIGKLTSVSGYCNVGPEVDNFNYEKVGMIILKRFPKQAVDKRLLFVCILFVY